MTRGFFEFPVPRVIPSEPRNESIPVLAKGNRQALTPNTRTITGE